MGNPLARLLPITPYDEELDDETGMAAPRRMGPAPDPGTTAPGVATLNVPPVARPEPVAYGNGEVFGRDLENPGALGRMQVQVANQTFNENANTMLDPMRLRRAPEPEPAPAASVAGAAGAAPATAEAAPKKPSLWGRVKNAGLSFGHSLLSGRGLVGAGVDAVAGAMTGKIGDGSMGRYGDMRRTQQHNAEVELDQKRRAEEADISYKAAQARYNDARAKGEGQQPEAQWDPKAGAWVVHNPDDSTRLIRPMDPSTGSTYAPPAEEEKFGVLPGQDAFYAYPKSNPFGIRRIDGSPVPAAATSAARTADIQQLETDDQIRARLLADPSLNYESVDAGVPSNLQAGARGEAVKEAIRDGKLPYSPGELQALEAIDPDDPQAQGKVDQINAARDKRFDAIPEAPYYVNKYTTGAKGQATEQERARRRQAFDQAYAAAKAERDAKKQGIYRDQRPGAPAAQTGAAPARPAVDSKTFLAALDGHPKQALVKSWFDMIDADPTVTDKEAAKQKAAASILSE